MGQLAQIDAFAEAPKSRYKQLGEGRPGGAQSRLQGALATAVQLSDSTHSAVQPTHTSYLSICPYLAQSDLSGEGLCQEEISQLVASLDPENPGSIRF